MCVFSGIFVSWAGLLLSQAIIISILLLSSVGAWDQTMCVYICIFRNLCFLNWIAPQSSHNNWYLTIKLCRSLESHNVCICIFMIIVSPELSSSMIWRTENFVVLFPEIFGKADVFLGWSVNVKHWLFCAIVSGCWVNLDLISKSEGDSVPATSPLQNTIFCIVRWECKS